jgi:hypothetical protein
MHRSVHPPIVPPSSTKEIPHPARQVGVIGRRGARLDELEALYRSRFEVFARVAASVTGDSERARDAVQDELWPDLVSRRAEDRLRRQGRGLVMDADGSVQ